MFAEVVDRFTSLLRDFGPPRKTDHPEYPFWRMQRDCIWQVITDTPPKMGADGAPTKRELLETNARGQFPDAMQDCLTTSPDLVQSLVTQLLDAHFPQSMHEDILVAVGLNLPDARAGRVGRDPNFRRIVLTAYGHQCAVCGLQLLLSGAAIALEAAHIRWHQACGPSSIQNGLCLCVLHHKVFDLGAITLTPELVVLVSDEAAGLVGLTEHLLAHHGRSIRRPAQPSATPDPAFIDWHRREVFRGNSRPI